MSQPASNSAAAARDLAAALRAVDENPTVVAISQAARECLPLAEQTSALPLRVACAASYTFDSIRPALQLQALRAGIALHLYSAPFAQGLRNLIDPASELSAFKPDVVIVAMRPADDCPALYHSFNSLAAQEVNRLADDWLDRLQSALTAFRARSTARVLIQNCERPAWPALGIADATAAHSQAAVIARINAGLQDMATQVKNACVMDYDSLIAHHGRSKWVDPRLALLARMPVAPAQLWALAGFYVRHIRPLVGLAKKVLVLDADNTLWGGVIGDTGIEGIALGPDYPGNAFVLFQQRILDLHRRGVLLCIASKNEPGVVEDAIARHPNMVLRPEHFAGIKANWSDKPGNLRQLAEELNLGIDSFVFMDDSPVECALMREALPAVLTVQLGDDPAHHARALEDLDCFEQWTVTEEDRQRGALYAADAGRRAAAATAVDMPTFLRQLEMRLSISVDDAMQSGRVAQLTQRTNQFNMNAIRCTDADIGKFRESAGHHVLAARLVDRFGDNGIIGAALVERSGVEWRLPVFLMSCRVLGRTVEQCFLKWIAGFARAAGATRLVGLFKPTVKNQPFAGFYQDIGMRPADNDGDVQQWVWELARADLAIPDWMTLETPVMPK